MDKYLKLQNIECAYCKKLCSNLKGFSYHLKMLHNIELDDYFEKFDNEFERPKCLQCGIMIEKQKTNYSFSFNRYMSQIFCSRKCTQKNSLVKNKLSIAGKRGGRKTLGRIPTKESREKQSIATSLAHINGFKHKKGEYISTKTNKLCKYRSSWELKYMMMLDNNNDVIFWEYEPFSIQYEYQNVRKNYIVDFEVYYNDKTKELIELGQKQQKFENPKNIAKISAGKEYAEKNGYTFKIVTEDNFHSFRTGFMKINLNNSININEIMISQKNLLELRQSYENEKYVDYVVNDLSNKILKTVRTFFPDFPIKQQFLTKELVMQIVECSSDTNVSKYLDNNTKIITASNHRFSTELKAHFNNFYDCMRRDSKSIKELYYDNDFLLKSILYRCGINNSKIYSYTVNGVVIQTNETFDISVKTIINGLQMLQPRVSFYSPILAATIYKMYLQNVDKPIIYDPSFGFGARYLASKIIENSTYIGTDPDEKTYNNMLVLSDTISDNSSIFYNDFSENVKLNRDINFSFTCPPYYDTEKYSYDIAEKYKTYDEWAEKYVRETAKNIYESLNLEPKMCVIQIPEEMRNDFVGIYKEVGFKHIEEQSYRVKLNRSHLSKKEKFEYLLCFKKS